MVSRICTFIHNRFTTESILFAAGFAASGPLLLRCFSIIFLLGVGTSNGSQYVTYRKGVDIFHLRFCFYVKLDKVGFIYFHGMECNVLGVSMFTLFFIFPFRECLPVYLFRSIFLSSHPHPLLFPHSFVSFSLLLHCL